MEATLKREVRLRARVRGRGRVMVGGHLEEGYARAVEAAEVGGAQRRGHQRAAGLACSRGVQVDEAAEVVLLVELGALGHAEAAGAQPPEQRRLGGRQVGHLALGVRRVHQVLPRSRKAGGMSGCSVELVTKPVLRKAQRNGLYTRPRDGARGMHGAQERGTGHTGHAGGAHVRVDEVREGVEGRAVRHAQQRREQVGLDARQRVPQGAHRAVEEHRDAHRVDGAHRALGQVVGAVRRAGRLGGGLLGLGHLASLGNNRGRPRYPAEARGGVRGGGGGGRGRGGGLDIGLLGRGGRRLGRGGRHLDGRGRGLGVPVLARLRSALVGTLRLVR
eukprot:scaffold100638_cov51-Phaeocystis_antarctica.AAC.2